MHPLHHPQKINDHFQLFLFGRNGIFNIMSSTFYYHIKKKIKNEKKYIKKSSAKGENMENIYIENIYPRPSCLIAIAFVILVKKNQHCFNLANSCH